jgi:hypothetical protein
MNLKQLGILLVLVVILGGAGLVLYRNQNAAWRGGDVGAGRKLLGELPVNEVSRISIRQGTNALNLVRKDDLWRVQERGDYPANFAQISEFLRKVADLKVIQSEKVGPSQLARLQLAPPGQGAGSAIMVEFDGRDDKPLRTLWVGKQHLKEPAGAAQSPDEDAGWPDGRYVRVGDSDTVAIISDPLEHIEPKPNDWLNKDFIRVEKAKTVEIAFPERTNSWKLTRDTESGDWKLADAKPGEQLDASAAAGISNPLSSVSVMDVLPGGKRDGNATNRPTVLTIETFDHFRYTVQMGRKAGEEYPVTAVVTAQIPEARTPGKDEKAADQTKLDQEFKEQRQKLEDKLKQEQGYENWTYLVQSWSLDPLLKERSQLLVTKKEEPNKGDNEPASPVGAAGQKTETELPASEVKQ